METIVKKTDRESSFELLRIIAMLMIIGHHYYNKGGLAIFAGTSVTNKYAILFLGQGGKAAVILLVLITGYFCVRKDCKPYNLLKTECAMQFCGVVFFAIACLTGAETFKLSTLVKNLFPFMFARYWFMTVYILMFLLLPFINKGLLMLGKQDHRRLLLFSCSMLYVTPLLNRLAFRKMETEYSQLVWSPLLWFLTVYLIGAYVGRFFREKQKGVNPTRRLLLGIALYGAGVLIEVFTDLYIQNAEISSFVYALLFSEESPLILVSMVLIFLFFKDHHLGARRWINGIAQGVMGVYLIHENEYMRGWIWGVVYRYEGFQ
nr:acyltransferase [Lachnospiraceae bacterium]